TTLAPIFLDNAASATTIPTINLCPPLAVASIPVGCPSTPTYPYYAPPNPSTPVVASALTPYNSAYSNAWVSSMATCEWNIRTHPGSGPRSPRNGCNSDLLAEPDR